jgi:uncharacterized protein (DUF2236 family)
MQKPFAITSNKLLSWTKNNHETTAFGHLQAHFSGKIILATCLIDGTGPSLRGGKCSRIQSFFVDIRWRDFYRTGRAMADMTFGTVQSALQAARHINNCHRRVRGILQEGTGRFLPACSYTAKDPHLKLRVLSNPDGFGAAGPTICL